MSSAISSKSLQLLHQIELLKQRNSPSNFPTSIQTPNHTTRPTSIERATSQKNHICLDSDIHHSQVAKVQIQRKSPRVSRGDFWRILAIDTVGSDLDRTQIAIGREDLPVLR